MTAKTNLKEKQDSTNNTFGMLIERIQMKDNRAIIKLKDESEEKLDRKTSAVKDEVTKKFADLWNCSVGIFTALVPALDKYKSRLRMNVVQFYYDKENFLKEVLFSVVYQFSDSGHVTNITLPKIPIYKPEMDEHTLAISGKDEELLHDILKAAKAYMNGDTKVQQMKLIVDNN